MSYAITIYFFVETLAQILSAIFREDQGLDDRAVSIAICIFAAFAGYWCVEHVWGMK